MALLESTANTPLASRAGTCIFQISTTPPPRAIAILTCDKSGFFGHFAMLH